MLPVCTAQLDHPLRWGSLCAEAPFQGLARRVPASWYKPLLKTECRLPWRPHKCAQAHLPLQQAFGFAKAAISGFQQVDARGLHCHQASDKPVACEAPCSTSWADLPCEGMLTSMLRRPSLHKQQVCLTWRLASTNAHLPSDGMLDSMIRRPRVLASRSALTRLTRLLVICSRMPLMTIARSKRVSRSSPLQHAGTKASAVP